MRLTFRNQAGETIGIDIPPGFEIGAELPAEQPGPLSESVATCIECHGPLGQANECANCERFRAFRAFPTRASQAAATAEPPQPERSAVENDVARCEIGRLHKQIELLRAERDAMVNEAKALQSERDKFERYYRAASEVHERDCQEIRQRAEQAEQQLAECRAFCLAWQSRAEKLQAFKTYVHHRFDEAGIPADDPDNEHSKQCCRVGARFDMLLASAAKWREAAIDGLELCKEPYDGNYEDWLCHCSEFVGNVDALIASEGGKAAMNPYGDLCADPKHLGLEEEVERLRAELRRLRGRDRCPLGDVPTEYRCNLCGGLVQFDGTKPKDAMP